MLTVFQPVEYEIERLANILGVSLELRILPTDPRAFDQGPPARIEGLLRPFSRGSL